MIFLVAVTANKTDPELMPHVSTPIGPYETWEEAAITRGRAFLRETYETEDIRTVEPGGGVLSDPDMVRGHVVHRVANEHIEAVRAARAEKVRLVLSGHEGGHWDDAITPWDVADADLDLVLEALGVNPEDV